MWDAIGAVGALMMGLGSMGISIHTKVKTNARLRAIERQQ